MSLSRRQIEHSVRIIEFVLKWMVRFFNTCALSALIAVMLVVMYQIFARFAPMKSPVWTEELSRYLFIYSIAFASGSVIVADRHIRLEWFVHRLSRRAALTYESIVDFGLAVFCMIILKYAWDFTINGVGETSPTLGIGKEWIYGSMVIFFGMTALASIMVVVRDILLLVRRWMRAKRLRRNTHEPFSGGNTSSEREDTNRTKQPFKEGKW